MMRRAAASLLLGALVLSSAAPASAAPVKVGPGAMGSWAIDRRDCSSGIPEGTTSFVAGPATPPAGSGSLRFAMADGQDQEMVRTAAYGGVRLDDLTAISYWTYVTASAGGQAAYLILDIDNDGDTTRDDALVFEAAYQHNHTTNVPDQGALVTGAWQSWNALAGGWWSSTTPGVSPGSGVKTIAFYLGIHPDARIINFDATGAPNGGGFRVVGGCGGSWNNFDGNADLLTVGVSGVNTQYDFDDDVVAPDTTITSGPSGPVNTDAATFTFTSNEPGSTFECSLDGGAFAACASPQAYGGLAEAPHTFAVRAIDPGANVDPTPATRAWTVDLTAPLQPAIATPTEGQIVTTLTPAITGSAEAGSTVTVYEGATPLGSGPATGGSFSIVTPPLSEGSHTVTVVAVDPAGNPSPASDTRSFIVDAPPAPPLITDPVEGASYNRRSLLFAGNAEPSSVVRVRKGASVIGSATADAAGKWSFTATLNPGVHTITATATDALAVESAPSPPRTFTIDQSPPVAPVIASPVAGATTGPSVTISGSAEAGTFLSVVEVHGDGTTSPVGTLTVSSSGSWTMVVSMPAGAHTVRAMVRDAAGNSSPWSADRGFFVDGAPPKITSAEPGQSVPLPGRTNTVKGTATDDRGVTRVEVSYYNATTSTFAGVQTANCPTCAASSTSVSWESSPAALLPGHYRADVVAFDAVGNRSTVVSISFLWM